MHHALLNEHLRNAVKSHCRRTISTILLAALPHHKSPQALHSSQCTILPTVTSLLTNLHPIINPPLLPPPPIPITPLLHKPQIRTQPYPSQLILIPDCTMHHIRIMKHHITRFKVRYEPFPPFAGGCGVSGGVLGEDAEFGHVCVEGGDPFFGSHFRCCGCEGAFCCEPQVGRVLEIGKTTAVDCAGACMWMLVDGMLRYRRREKGGVRRSLATGRLWRRDKENVTAPRTVYSPIEIHAVRKSALPPRR